MSEDTPTYQAGNQPHPCSSHKQALEALLVAIANKQHQAVEVAVAAAYQTLTTLNGSVEITPEMQHWLVAGDCGRSSEVMFQHLAGFQVQRKWCDHPADPSDFSRCRLLLEAAPALRRDLFKMQEVSPYWAALVARWDEVCNVMDAECPDWRKVACRPSNTYSLMTDIFKTVDECQEVPQ